MRAVRRCEMVMVGPSFVTDGPMPQSYALLCCYCGTRVGQGPRPTVRYAPCTKGQVARVGQSRALPGVLLRALRDLAIEDLRQLRRVEVAAGDHADDLSPAGPVRQRGGHRRCARALCHHMVALG